MTALIIIGSVLLFLAFLLFLGIKLTIAYDGNVSLWISVLFVKIKLIPKKEKRGPKSMSRSKAEKIKQKLEKKRRKKLEKKKDKAEKKTQGRGKKEKKSLSEILDIIDLSKKLLSAIVKKLFKHLCIHAMRIKLKIAMEDAAKTAIAYGAVTQAINLLFPILEDLKGFKTPQRNNIDVQADFLSEESEIDICFAFKIRVWQVLHIGIATLIALIKHKASKEENGEDKETEKETN